MQISDEPDAQSVGLLLVPRRPPNATPVAFRKDSPEKASGNRSFNKGIYLRVRDECRPAVNTSEDWRFLHSERAPPDRPQSITKPKVRSSMPARDSELLKFLGRNEQLAELRNWLADKRSPVRLITGIGGLGKTTLAVNFAEEVIETGAGGLEWVIWLTAKQQTFSALRGKMVKTGRVDFTDLISLYDEILKLLSYKFPVEVEEPTPDEMIDRVVEALSIIPSLVIVDDIDSLLPDEQKEVVASLISVATRTVGKDLAPSRILMTSRIDQGLSPTSVVKISGLERNAFAEHVFNLCNLFKIPPIVEEQLEQLFGATSGSPLFAASIIRLVRLGENVRVASTTWMGQEGEEVRAFAFERELKRLDTVQARLLFAAILLGETSVNDLADVLDVTVRVVRDRVSELQAYHLITVGKKETGDTSIIPPSDLIAVAKILRSHLGDNAKSVEIACARAEERSATDNKTIGLGIRGVLAAWDAGDNIEAVARAQKLRTKFSNNGDVASIYGATLLKLSPSKVKEADEAFEAASRSGCTRPELLNYRIRTKTELQDWHGLYNLTEPLSSNETARDIPLTAFLRACHELIVIARDRGDDTRIAALSIDAIEKITAKTSRLQLESVFLSALVNDRISFARTYVDAINRSNGREGDKLRVFEGVARLIEIDVIVPELIGTGVSALQVWWRNVESRPVVDKTTCAILLKQLRRLDKIQRQIATDKTISQGLLAKLTEVNKDLAHRGAQLCL